MYACSSNLIVHFFIIQYIYYMIKLFSGLGPPSYAEAIQLAARESPTPSAPELQLEPDSVPAAVSMIYHIIPAGTHHSDNVASTSMRRLDVASPLMRRCINVMCPLGYSYD